MGKGTIKQADAKQAIRQLWFKRDKDKRTLFDILAFYIELEKEQSELLHFKCSGDKYQAVRGWLEPYIEQPQS